MVLVAGVVVVEAGAAAEVLDTGKQLFEATISY